MSSTKYLLKDDGQLNHGHTTSGSPTIVQWHKATIYHRDDPTAHDRADSWDTNSEWSSRGVWKTRSEREQLIANAHAAHDKGVELPKTTVDLLHTHEVKQPTPPPAQTTTTPASTNGQSELASQILDAISTRLTDAEDGTLLAMDSANAAKESIKSVDANVRELIAKSNAQSDLLTQQAAKIEQLEKAANVGKTITLVRPDGTKTTLTGLKHRRQDDLLEILGNLDPSDRNIALTGPAGSGKTTAARLCARALFGEERPLKEIFRAMGAIASPFQISGYNDAQGRYVRTPARDMFEYGGVLLFDEFDGSSANALLEINAMTANGFHQFPDGLVERHKDCYIIAAGNTWGFGATANFMGRNRLDDATLDRFGCMEWPYDNDLEMAVGPVPTWTRTVQSIRAKCNTAELKIVVSPRATMRTGTLLARGVRAALAVEASFGRFKERDGRWPAPLRELDEFVRNWKPATETATPPAIPQTSAQAKAELPQNPQHIDFSGTR